MGAFTATPTIVATPTAQRMLAHHEEIRATLYAERSAAVFFIATELAGDRRVVERAGPFDDGDATTLYVYTRCSEDAFDLLDQANKHARPAGLSVAVAPSDVEGLAHLWKLHVGVGR